MNIKWNWRHLFLESADSITAKGHQSGGSVLVRSFVCMVFAVLVLKFVACFFFSLWPPLLAGAYMVLTLWAAGWCLEFPTTKHGYLFTFVGIRFPVTEKRLGRIQCISIQIPNKCDWVVLGPTHLHILAKLGSGSNILKSKLAGFRSGFQNHIQT